MNTSLHSVNIEQAILSSLMTVDKSYESMEIKLTADDFYAQRHKEIYLAIEALHFQSQPYDLVMVGDYLGNTNKLLSVGGEQYLIQLMSDAPSSFYNLETYAVKLKKLTECRKIEDAGRRIIELAQNTLIEDMPNMALEIISGVEPIISTDSRHSLQDSAVTAFEVISRKQLYKADGGKQSYGVRTGLVDLDALLGDIEPGHYMTIAAAPGGGKTTMAQMIALNAVKTNDVPCLFMSCEMEHHEVTNRIMSAQARIPFKNIQTADMTSDEMQSWVAMTAHIFPNYKLDIVDKAGVSIQEIRGEIKKTIQKYGSIGCVIVDYIQLLTDNKAKDQFEKISNVSMGLKKIAKDFKVPVIALSQLTKEATSRKITMADLRGSGQIAQDSDKIVLLSPDSNGVGVVVAEVAKNRQGEKGEARLVTRFDVCQFTSVKREF